MLRGVQARRHLALRHRAASVLQRRYRAMMAARRQREVYRVTRAAVITCQAAARRWLARRRLATMHRAATTLQAHYRAHKARQVSAEKTTELK